MLVEESTFTTNASQDEVLFSKLVEEFSTNGYKSYNEGAVLKNGQKEVSEADLKSKEEPVTGVALFATKFYQTRLLQLMKEPIIDDVKIGNEEADAINGSVTIEGEPAKVTLSFAKADHLLLSEKISSLNSSASIKFIATRALVSRNGWPYSSISYEIYSKSNLVSRATIPISIKQIPKESDASPDKLIFPIKTLVTDERFGYPVCYVLDIPPLTDADIAKMATDPDYRTNSYFLKFYHIVKSRKTSTSDEPEHFIGGVVIISLTGLVFVLATLWWRRRTASLS